MEQLSTLDSFLPRDLISEILLRLPAKSVAKFRCVSKLWLSITTDPCFIKSFGTTRPSLLLCSIQGHNMFVTPSIRSYSSSQPIYPYPMKVLGEHCYFPHMDSVRGYDPVEGQESWRTVKTNIEHSVAVASGRCIKGVIYYLAFKSQGSDAVVMSFDVRSEIFHMIELPSSIHWDSLITYEGRLACIDANNDKRLWSLEDATDKHKWSFQDFLSPLYKMFELQGSTHAGEFIYVPFNKSPYIELYDPVGNSYKYLNINDCWVYRRQILRGPQGGCSVQGRKLKSHLAAPTVLLLTTVKPKIIGGERTLLYSPDNYTFDCLLHGHDVRESGA
ncbi:hypothetical protein HID58_019108 [Brassica napus]|uniref:F-box domain-containing protein n=1 Tax=Brassica napus TaxID=3708 RepID=A0ABQ8DBY1_BRANA|nr:hypothetical protein HID58_019108 [Brassica napus]